MRQNAGPSPRLFFAAMPTRSDPAGGPDPPDARDSPAPPGSPAGGLRALLVDDRPGPREEVANVLRRTLPHVVLDVAASREEARPLIEAAAGTAAAGDAPAGRYEFAVLRDGMAWDKGMRLPQFAGVTLPGTPLILTCDPTTDEGPPEAQDPALAPAFARDRGLGGAIIVAGDDAAAVAAAAAASLKLAGRAAGPLTGPDAPLLDAPAVAAGDPDQTAAENLPGVRAALAAERAALAAERRKVVALLRAAERTAAREAAARRKLARVLHEDMLQTLVGARMMLSCARVAADRDGGAGPAGPGGGNAEAVDMVDGLLLRSVQMCKDLTGLWSPLVLYEAGLVAALRWLAGDRRDSPLAGLALTEEEHAAADHGPGDGAGRDAEHSGSGEHDADADDPEAALGPLPAGLTVSVDCDEDAEPATQDGRLLLYQAAVELLANVARHARVEEATLTLRRLPAPDGAAPGDRADPPDLLALTVADAGAGFDAAPAPAGTDGADGLGGGDGPAGAAAPRFGLFSLRERLALAGGRLEIESVAGEGSRVTAVCPRDAGRPARRPFFADGTGADETGADETGADEPFEAHPGRAEPNPEMSSDAVADGPRGPLRVLIADDNRIIQLSVGSLLKSEGDIEVVGSARDGIEAVTLALELDPDVVLMDISMPKLDGVEATRRLKAAAPHVRVIGLSMHETDDRERDMFEAGAERYVVKDGPPEALLTALRSRPAPLDAGLGAAAD